MIRAFTTAISVAALGLITALPATAQEPKGGVVSIGGAVTEIVFALGAQDQLVAPGIRPLAIRLKPLPCRTWAICARSRPKGCWPQAPS